jgi:cytochrome b
MSDTSIKPEQSKRLVKVWDLPTRIFHWSLVSMVLISYLTGYIFPEWWMGVHLWAGYITVTLLMFRLVWGMFGSEYARLESFTFSPVHILQHVKEVITLRSVSHYIGHTPSGALMIFGLLFVLSAITLSGLLVLGGEENQGPLAGAANYAVGDIAAGIHESFVILLLAMIAMHVGGVFLEIKLTGENLINAMISGLKKLPEGAPDLAHRDARPLAAALALGAFVILAGGTLWPFSTMPPSGLTTLPPNAAYETECGDCHATFHPSLLPIESWKGVMAGLDDHFGEDAALYDDVVTAEITAYLVQFGGEKWDTEASNRFRKVNPAAPLQITALPYWVRKHADIMPEVFKRKGVGAKSNCSACHLDHYTGRFDDQMITIPKE